MFVFWGKEGGGFEEPVPIEGSEGEPLAIAESGDEAIKSCPFPADLNGDGIIDLVTGNAAGTFAVFYGIEPGVFEQESEWLKAPDGSPLKIRGSDSGPNCHDWDGDGDLDIVTGSRGNTVFLITNEGTKTDCAFGEPVVLIRRPRAPFVEQGEEPILGVAHIKSPDQNVRVAVRDVNDDGKLDLVLGDRQFLSLVNDGVSAEEAERKLKAWNVKKRAHQESVSPKVDKLDFDNMESWNDDEKTIWSDYMDSSDVLEKEFELFAKDLQAGFVWLYLQK